MRKEDDKKIEYFDMSDDDIPLRYMALCVWVSEMTDGGMTVQDVHSMVDDLISEYDFEYGKQPNYSDDSKEVH